MENAKTLSKDAFVELLRLLLLTVEHDDSFEGRLEYRMGEERNTFDVNAFIRNGFQDGQGGAFVIQADN